MITLSKENLTEYLKSQINFLDYSKPLVISEVGEGSVEEDGDVGKVQSIATSNKIFVIDFRDIVTED